MAEEWLNGWPRMGSTVLVGSTVHCAGCGKDYGAACVAIDENWVCPEKAPDWPFNETDCPLCAAITERMEGPEMEGPEDKLTRRLLALKAKP